VPKLLLNVLLSFSLLGLEGYCLLTIFGLKVGYGNDAQLALFMHFWACFVAALILPKLLSAKYQSPKNVTAVFFFSIAFFIPLLGILGLITAIIPGLREIKNDRGLSLQYTKIRQLSDSQKNHDTQYEKESVNLENLLHSHNPEKRMSAVYATLKLDDKDAIPLLRLALRDPVDDIRLLAYALIDRKEQRISERIENAKQNLENNLSSDTLHIYRSMANDYSEIAHLGLVEGETLNFILSNTLFYLEKGLQLYPQDRGLHFLHAKLLLKVGKLQEAYDEFKVAENLGISKQKLLLYYAEIDFKLRRYPQVKQKMKEIKFTSARPEIVASARFWLETPVGR
jgi:polysaccharide biosynthesis protein PelE